MHFSHFECVPHAQFLQIAKHLDDQSLLALRLTSHEVKYLVEPLTWALFARSLETIETNLSYDSIWRIHYDLCRPRGNPLAQLVKRLAIRYPFTGPNTPFNRAAISSEIEDPLALREIRILRDDLEGALTRCRDFAFYLDSPAGPIDCIHSGDVVRVMFDVFNAARIPLRSLKIMTHLHRVRRGGGGGGGSCSGGRSRSHSRSSSIGSGSGIIEQPTTIQRQIMQLPNLTVPALHPECLGKLRKLHLHDDYFREFRGTSIVWELLECTPALEELRVVGARRVRPTGNILEALSTAQLASQRIRVFDVRKVEVTVGILQRCLLNMAERGLETLELRDVVLDARSGSWEDVLGCAWRECLDLSRLVLSGLGVRRDHCVRTMFRPGSSMIVSGSVLRVGEELRQLVQRARIMEI
ncbi:uncharacterized protein BO97DRAFT_451058 [Aspergillus homomorphus CBS 101889]|uniref:F-box domain-containing protein n=1 Tax=Aspergillus homomorphus (strain CBS 101889) TaxID=1450537 RepID=A0A395I1G1_ASPHC|nr:hypothetical protein BO97DRAFT_451058 [Aspergillus homomorphus CBS 101889]RAL12998.1 hypothetical protein BO97DRAFT_451058 [Aspergillus homomorphus CBS 101889]